MPVWKGSVHLELRCSPHLWASKVRSCNTTTPWWPALASRTSWECVTMLAYLYIRQWTAYHRLTSPVTVAVYPMFKADLRCALRLTTNLSFQGRKPSLMTDISLWLVHRLGTIYLNLLRHQHLSSNSNRGWKTYPFKESYSQWLSLYYSALVFDVVHVYGTLNIVLLLL